MFMYDYVKFGTKRVQVREIQPLSEWPLIGQIDSELIHSIGELTEVDQMTALMAVENGSPYLALLDRIPD